MSVFKCGIELIMDSIVRIKVCRVSNDSFAFCENLILNCKFGIFTNYVRQFEKLNVYSIQCNLENICSKNKCNLAEKRK